MNLSFDSQERCNKDGTKVSILYRSKKKKFDCPFFLEFRFQSSEYALKKYDCTHNHKLSVFVFMGIPCRHMILLANSNPEIKIEHLPFNPRWRIDFYKEISQNEKSGIQKNSTQEIIQQNGPKIHNPLTVAGPGRPTTTSQREKSFIEGIAKTSKKKEESFNKQKSSDCHKS